MYAATIDNRRLTFEVFGVWRKNLVMRDRETGSIWQQATGEAIDGPLKGKQLEILMGWETTWGALQVLYPQVCYAVEPERFTGLMPKPVLNRALRITHIANLYGTTPADKRLDPHEMVVGLVLNGVPKAYPLLVLKKNRNITDRVGGEEIQVEYHLDSDRVIVCTAAGKPVHYERQWWLGWSEFHPRSAIYGDGGHEH